jgi:DNA replication and repair protein RecF
MDRLWIEGADGRRRFLDRMVLSFVPGHADAVLAYEKAMRERNRLLKEQERDTGWYGALEAQMATSGAEISVNRRKVLERIIEAQRDSTTAFPAADMQIVDAEGSCHPEDPLDLAEALAEGTGRAILRRVELSSVRIASIWAQSTWPRGACGAVFHRRAEGSAGVADPGQCAGSAGGHRPGTAPAAGRGGGASGCWTAVGRAL